MGWLSALGNIAAIAGAPFTGGASLAALPVINAATGAIEGVSEAAGGAAGAMNDQSNTEANRQLMRDRLKIDRAQANLSNQGTRMAQSRKASMMANFQPTKINWGGPGSGLRGQTAQFSGGFSNPKIYSDIKPQMDDVIRQNLLTQLQHGADLPDVTPEPKASTSQKTLGGLALAGSIATPILKALSGYFGSKAASGRGGNGTTYDPSDTWGYG